MSAITYEEVLSLFKETDREIKESSREFREAHRKNLREIQEIGYRLRELERVTLEHGKHLYEQTRQIEEHTRQLEEQTRQIEERGRQIDEQGRQIGGLGDKFGYFTEGMAMPSMERILAERFGMTFVMPRVRIRKNGETIEIDVLAYANDAINRAIVVEVKSRARAKAIEQLRKLMTRFREFYPEHESKEVIGILAGVDWERGIADKAREEGFLTASIRDEMFQLTVPEGFRARCW
uniref:DUF8196 domain-containing protein n=1 Tax=Candidatus Kentrum sp. TC TaxID=2126339 RepID=A0A451A2K6_9GAMM|nr:MAG: Protein of unknown function (DUF3782) [Candidatus Kentron sp. TC]VFK60247.1 MAG: Protein of unknown function (DUF3782) [Candidatus Kentron sp. TC]